MFLLYRIRYSVTTILPMVTLMVLLYKFLLYKHIIDAKHDGLEKTTPSNYDNFVLCILICQKVPALFLQIRLVSGLGKIWDSHP